MTTGQRIAAKRKELSLSQEALGETLNVSRQSIYKWESDSSLPDIDNRERELIPIPGLMPDPTNLPEGCPFAPRCRYATPKCSEALPEEKWVSDTHFVACSRYDEPDFHIERKVAQDG